MASNNDTKPLLPARADFLANLKEVALSSLPSDRRDCGVCQCLYGETDDERTLELQSEPEPPVILPCGHTLGKACLILWLNSMSKDNFNTTCPFCRTELYGHALDDRIIRFGDTIRELEWDASSLAGLGERQLRPTVMRRWLARLDSIVNEGAVLGEQVYPLATRRAYNPSLVQRWFHSMETEHLPGSFSLLNASEECRIDDDMRRVLGGIRTAVQHAILDHRLSVLIPTCFVDASKHPERISHFMMPSAIWARITMAAEQQIKRTRWRCHLPATQIGNSKMRLFKRIMMYQALMCAVIATTDTDARGYGRNE